MPAEAGRVHDINSARGRGVELAEVSQGAALSEDGGAAQESVNSRTRKDVGAQGDSDDTCEVGCECSRLPYCWVAACTRQASGAGQGAGGGCWYRQGDACSCTAACGWIGVGVVVFVCLFVFSAYWPCYALKVDVLADPAAMHLCVCTRWRWGLRAAGCAVLAARWRVLCRARLSGDLAVLLERAWRATQSNEYSL